MALNKWDVQEMQKKEDTYIKTLTAATFFLEPYASHNAIPKEELLDFVGRIKVHPNLLTYETPKNEIREMPYFYFILNPPPMKSRDEEAKKKSLFSRIFS